MDILNFISWIKGKRLVTSVSDDALVPVGIRTPQRDDKYTTVAIKKSDLIPGYLDNNGNYISGDSSNNTVNVAPGGTHDIPNFSGMLIVNDHYSGRVETWSAGSGDSALLGYTGIGTPTSTVTQNGNGYQWTNNNNLNGPFTFTVIKTRNSA